MDLKRLKYFVVAAEEENFHRAAARLYLAQPALSRHIKELETELGLSLFDRSKKRVHLSAAGHFFLKQARKILADMEQAAHQTRLVSDGMVGTLRISFNPTCLGHRIVPDSFQNFRLAFSEVELKLHMMISRVQIEAVQSRTIDVGFIVRDTRTALKHIDSFEVATAYWVLAVPATHRLASREDLKLADFKGLMVVPREESPETYDKLVPAGQAAGLKPTVVHTGVDSLLGLGLVASGMGLFFLTTSICEQYAQNNVVFKRLSDFPELLHVDMIWRQDDTSPLLARYIQTMKALRTAQLDAPVIHRSPKPKSVIRP